MAESQSLTGRLQLILIATVFLGPLMFAVWLYFSGDELRPDGRANSGALLEPIVNLQDMLPTSPLHAKHGGRWLLVYDKRGACDDRCREALHTIRQSRLMLGREMERLERIFLHGESPLDTVFLETEHEGLITLQDGDLRDLLENKKPDELQAGGYYLIDPQGNLVMYFHPELEPREMVDDIKRLLKLSRIG